MILVSLIVDKLICWYSFNYYLSIRFHNSCRRLPETKRLSSLLISEAWFLIFFSISCFLTISEELTRCMNPNLEDQVIFCQGLLPVALEKSISNCLAAVLVLVYPEYFNSHHIWWAFPYPSPGEAPDGRLASSHEALSISLFIHTLSITISINLWFAPQISEHGPYRIPGRLNEKSSVSSSPPRCKWHLSSSGMLCRVDWQLVVHGSWHP